MIALVVIFSIASRRPAQCRHVTKNSSPQLLLSPALTKCDAHNSFRIRSYENCRVSPALFAKNLKLRLNFVSPCHAARCFSCPSFTPADVPFQVPYLLPSSVCRNSFVCHSYVNTGVWGYSSHFGTARALSQSRTPCWIQVLSFQTLAHSFVPFCTHQKLNPFLFNRFPTLCQKKVPAGVGIFQLTTFNFQLSIVGSSRTIPASRPGRRHDL